MKNHGRSRQEVKRDKAKNYCKMESDVDPAALERLRKPAYSSIDVAGYLDKIRGERSGQAKVEKIHTKQGET